MWSARFTQVDTSGKLKKYVKAFGSDRLAAILWLKEEPGRIRFGGSGKAKGRTLVTVSDLCDMWLEHVQTPGSGYKDQKNPPQRIRLIKQQFGPLPAHELRALEIRRWLDTNSHLKPATLNRLKATLSAVYRFGKENDQVDVNPARDLKARKVGTGVVRFLSPDEENAIRSILQADTAEAEAAHGVQTDEDRTRRSDRSQRIKRLQHRIYELDVSLGTGLRKSEQYGLEWRDIDFDRRQITARDTKNGENRTVPMIDDVYAAFRGLQALALTRKDRANDQPNPASADSVFAIGDNKKWWERTLRLAKVTNYRWHDNRHTFCSRLAQAGVNLKVIQEAAGHKTIQMSARYAHMDKSSLANAMAVLNRH